MIIGHASSLAAPLLATGELQRADLDRANTERADTECAMNMERCERSASSLLLCCSGREQTIREKGPLWLCGDLAASKPSSRKLGRKQREPSACEPSARVAGGAARRFAVAGRDPIASGARLPASYW